MNLKRKNLVILIPLFSLILSCALFFRISHEEKAFLGFWLVYTLQFVFFTLLIFAMSRGRRFSLNFMLAVALSLRVILWFTEPVLENDYWRYLWDGRVLAHGINPYLYAPMDSALDFLSTSYRQWIGWPKFHTIYPPLAEIFFAVTHLIAPDSLLGLKIMLTSFDLATGLILIYWLKAQDQDPLWSCLYFLNPLVLKEIANSAHLDSIAVFLSMAALYIFTLKPHKNLWGWILLALATSAKLYPAVFVPLVLRVDTHWKKRLAIYMTVMAALYAPFLGAWFNLFGGTEAYAKYWIFNAGVFQVVTTALNGLFSPISALSKNPFFAEALKMDYLAKLLLGLFFFVALFWHARKMTKKEDIPQAALFVLELLLLLSPVMNAWYVLWILPLACLTRNVPWLSFSYLVIAGYSWFHSRENAPFFRMAEYGIFFLLLLWWRFWRGKNYNARRSREFLRRPKLSLSMFR